MNIYFCISYLVKQIPLFVTIGVLIAVVMADPWRKSGQKEGGGVYVGGNVGGDVINGNDVREL